MSLGWSSSKSETELQATVTHTCSVPRALATALGPSLLLMSQDPDTVTRVLTSPSADHTLSSVRMPVMSCQSVRESETSSVRHLMFAAIGLG